MSEKQDGGPAFPNPPNTKNWDAVHGVYTQHGGMTLRDWFAGQALAGMCANADESYRPYEELAKRAYLQADAMIAARVSNDNPQR
jgi:hypothetical protein